MTGGAGDGPSAYLSSISSVLGDETPLADVDEEIVRSELPNLYEQGLKYCRVSTQPAITLAAESARQTLAAVPDGAVDAIVYCTDTSPDKTTTSDGWDLLLALDRPTVPMTVLGGSGCGNLGPGLAVARNMVRVGDADTVLLVTGDRVKTGTRYLENGQTVLSDGAASCVVSSRRYGPAFRIDGLSSSFRVDIGTVAARPIIVARATAGTIKNAVRQVTEPLSLAASEFRYLLPGYYGRGPQAFLAMSAGFPTDRVYCPLLAEVGHCFSADVLLSLASLRETRAADDGDRLMLLAMSPRSWSIVVATQVGGSTAPP